jgi:hypothetical protein
MAMIYALRWMESVTSEDWLKWLWMVILASFYSHLQQEQLKLLMKKFYSSMPSIKDVRKI